VADEGIGIPPEDCARLFQPFERGSNVGNIKGTGLGLSIVKRMSDLLGGTITLDSTIGAGTRFTLILPRLTTSPAT
jgi:signal transduction histidine kinase